MLYILPGIIIGLTLHEFSHACTANALGDHTPKNQGRLTLNPLKHIDPLGFILLLIVQFGWARPVETRPMNFKDPKRDSMIVALAGPLANIFIAFLTAFILRFSVKIPYGPTVLQGILWGVIEMNVLLFVLNLLPIPPLDGSKILLGILPSKIYYDIMQYDKIISILFIFLALSGYLGSILNKFYTPILRFISQILI